jgi:hypothetical protein
MIGKLDMLMWKCPNKKLKDLHLIEKETLNRDIYRKLIQRFVKDTESINKRVNKDLLKDLNQLPEKGILRSRKTNKSGRYSRKGYFTLYRWCTTEHNAAQKVSKSAIELWEFLFCDLPPKLVGSENSYLSVDDGIWEEWYKKLCKPDGSIDPPLNLIETTIEISEGQKGISYEILFKRYLIGTSIIKLVDPYIRYKHQIQNLISFCQILFSLDGEIRFKLITAADSNKQIQYLSEKYNDITKALKERKILFSYSFDKKIHDRWIESDSGWKILLSRGLDIFKKPEIEFSDQINWPCKATTITYIKMG